MAKVGLKDTLALLAAGYKKKDIDALAELDDANDAQQAEVPAPIITDSAPAPAPAPIPEEDKKIDPEMVKQMEELQAKLKESEEKLKRLQKENINKDSAPMAEEQKKQQNDSLLNLVRGFM